MVSRVVARARAPRAGGCGRRGAQPREAARARSPALRGTTMRGTGAGIPLSRPFGAGLAGRASSPHPRRTTTARRRTRPRRPRESGPRRSPRRARAAHTPRPPHRVRGRSGTVGQGARGRPRRGLVRLSRRTPEARLRGALPVRPATRRARPHRRPAGRRFHLPGPRRGRIRLEACPVRACLPRASLPRQSGRPRRAGRRFAPPRRRFPANRHRGRGAAPRGRARWWRARGESPPPRARSRANCPAPRGTRPGRGRHRSFRRRPTARARCGPGRPARAPGREPRPPSSCTARRTRRRRRRASPRRARRCRGRGRW